MAKSTKRHFYSQFHIIGAFLLGCCFATAGVNLVYFSALEETHTVSLESSSSSSSSAAASSASAAKAMVHHPATVAKIHVEKAKETAPKLQKLAANHANLVHPVAGLDCSEHDGPFDPEHSKEMVYWRDIPTDNAWTSPFQKTPPNNTDSNNTDNTDNNDDHRQYLTFEPDGGGWNNIRMSMETVLTMALAMGRVLVLPPSQKMYLLGQTTFNFADFFPLQELAEEHKGLEIITTEQFLKETMGKTFDTKTKKISFPPEGKRTAWDGDTHGILRKLAPWIRSIATQPDWDPTKCIAAFPKSTDPKDAALLQKEFDEIIAEKDGFYASKNAYKEFINNPTPVDAPSKDRLREMITERTKLCLYDQDLQEAKIIHFHGKAKKDEGGGRLLVHFYAFLFHQDYRTDLWMKRFVRDHVRYIDNIQCAAARIVHKLRTEYGKQGGQHNNNNNNNFDSFHIRRGDFQYKATRIEASKIVERARDVIEEGRVVYVGTDERNKNFFKPLVEDAGWKVLFLDDFLDEVGKGIDPHYYGMIDQLVVSRGDRFFGCWFSTFTGYIMRLRGYHSQAIAAAAEEEETAHGGDKDQSNSSNSNARAFEQGKLPNSYYYALEDSKTKMHDYWPVKKVFYAREFPTSWRQLDVVD